MVQLISWSFDFELAILWENEPVDLQPVAGSPCSLEWARDCIIKLLNIPVLGGGTIHAYLTHKADPLRRGDLKRI